MLGAVLTFANSIGEIAGVIEKQQLTALKVVTGWGLPTAWDAQSRAELVRVCRQRNVKLLVRTVAGDPSANKPFLHHQEVLTELFPWVEAGARLFELGNEPDVIWHTTGIDEQLIWEYYYYAEQALSFCRRYLPKDCRFIGPTAAIFSSERWERWWQIGAHALKKYDFVAAHLYAHHSFFEEPSQFKSALRANSEYVRLPIVFTEAGINDYKLSPSDKLALYRKQIKAFALPKTDFYIFHYDRSGKSTYANYAVF